MKKEYGIFPFLHNNILKQNYDGMNYIYFRQPSSSIPWFVNYINKYCLKFIYKTELWIGYALTLYMLIIYVRGLYSVYTSKCVT